MLGVGVGLPGRIRLERLPLLPQAFVGAIQALRDNSCMGRCRHEVRVAGPARHDVDMDMISDAGTGRRANIDAYVEGLSAVGAPQNFKALAGQLHQFSLDRIGEVDQRRNMQEGDDHHVAVSVRVAVEDGEAVSGPMQDQVLRPVGLRQTVAEQAASLMPA